MALGFERPEGPRDAPELFWRHLVLRHQTIVPLLGHADAFRGVLECEQRDYVTRHELRAIACSGSSIFASSDSAGKSGLTCETSLYSSRAIMYMRLSSPCTVTL